MSSAARTTRKPSPLPPAYPPLPVRRFTVDEYHRMIATGILRSGEPYELIYGWIVEKMTINPAHAYTVGELGTRLSQLGGGELIVRTQQPITIGAAGSEPEPDVAVAAGPGNRYKNRHPEPRDVPLVIEVADSSLAEDRSTKLQLYAAAKIPVYWIVNLVDRRVEVYSQPRGGKNPAYRHQDTYGPDDAVPVIVGGRELGTIPVRELLP
jgi:Uma2 family endonuclease